MHMHIIVGKTRKELHLGYVADFCPICRSVRAFQFFADTERPHIYHVAAGPEKELGHIKVCLDCGIRLPANPDVFTCIAKSLPQRLEDLVSESFPDVYSAHAKRLRLEESIGRDPYDLSAEDRIRLIREPFDLLDPIFAHKSKTDRELDRKFGNGILIAIGVPTVLVYLAPMIGLSLKPYDHLIMPAVVVAVVGGLASAIHAFVTGRRRILQYYLMPILVRGLRPLKPKSGEIDIAMQSLRSGIFRLGKKLKASAILEALSSPGREPGRQRSWTGGVTAVMCPDCGTRNSVAGHWGSSRPVCKKCGTQLHCIDAR